MSSYRQVAASVSLMVGVIACGGPPPATPNTQKNDVVIDDGSGKQVVADAPGAGKHDVSPVTAPGELVLHLRWKNPGATLATAAAFAKLPAGFVNQNLRSVVRDALDETIRNTVNAEKMSQVVDLDAPIDLVAVADVSGRGPVPEPMFAWSVGLTSLDAALAASNGKPEPMSNGAFRVGTAEEWASPCAVAPAAGKSPARLVCVERKRMLEKLVPYVARNVATMPEPERDLRATLDLRPILDKYGRQWSSQVKGLPILVEDFKLGNPTFDRALVEAADALALEAGALIADGDRVVAELGFSGPRGVDAAFEITYAGSQSWLVQTITESASRKGPPPAIFWQLPEESAMATYAHGSDPTRWEPIMKNLATLLEGSLESIKIGTAADRSALADLLRLRSKKAVASVSATGAFDSGKAAPTTMQGMIDSFMGWQLLGIEDDAKEYKGWLNDAVRAYNRPAFQKALKKELGSDAKHLPKVKTVRAPREAGAGALAIEVTVPEVEDAMADLLAAGGPVPPPTSPTPPKKAKTVDLKGYLLLMADGDRTWIGVAGDLDALAKLMATTKGKTPGPGTLDKRTALSRFRTTRHNGATFSSLDGAIDSMRPLLAIFATAGAPSSLVQQIEQALAGLPNKGVTPVVLTGDVEAGAKPKLHIELNVPKETLEDLGFLVEQALTLAAGMGGRP
ncbi:MAG: hypothetical protein R3B72_27240 [Polyangiaceae bacterium]